MSFTFVNKNLLIPQIEIYQDFNTSVQKLLDISYNTDKIYCSNIYVVSTDCIYFTNGKYLYTVSNSNLVKKIDIKKPNKSHLKIFNCFLNSENDDITINSCENFDKSNTNIPPSVKDLKNKITVKKQTVNIINNKNEEIIHPSVEVKNESCSKSKEELELLKLCEETMEIYQNEVRKMKEIEQKIIFLENNTKSLLKKKKEKTVVNFSKIKNDYNTYKLINKKLEKKPDMLIPSLFVQKYSYFCQLLNNVDNLKMLNLIDELNLDEVLNKDCELDEELQFFVNEYGELSKKLNVKFDHSWEELESDTSEGNNSRLGSC